MQTKKGPKAKSSPAAAAAVAGAAVPAKLVALKGHLSTMPDGAIATAAGVSKIVVREYRLSLGIHKKAGRPTASLTGDIHTFLGGKASPAKAPVADAPVKRGPGRPRKVVAAAAAPVAAAAVKRGPGRPRKVVAAAAAPVAAAAVKRGPGRPRKVVAAVVAPVAAAAVKRGPGRPRKVVAAVVAPVAAAAVKRGPGRPRKVVAALPAVAAPSAAPAKAAAAPAAAPSAKSDGGGTWAWRVGVTDTKGVESECIVVGGSMGAAVAKAAGLGTVVSASRVGRFHG